MLLSFRALVRWYTTGDSYLTQETRWHTTTPDVTESERKVWGEASLPVQYNNGPRREIAFRALANEQPFKPLNVDAIRVGALQDSDLFGTNFGANLAQAKLSLDEYRDSPQGWETYITQGSETYEPFEERM